MSGVDLRELAVDREATIRPRRHVMTRYVLPMMLIVGFVALAGWETRDLLFRPREVTVMPVVVTTTLARESGETLFQAAGWIEPRPTPIRVAALAPGVIERLLVVEDQHIERGEAIAELIRDDAQLALELAVADLSLEEAALEEATAIRTAARTRYERPVHLEATLRTAEAELAKVNTQLNNLPFEVRRAEADRDALQRDYDSKSAAEGVVAGVAIDIAKSKLDAAKALVDELRERTDSLREEHVALSGRRDAVTSQLGMLADETEALAQANAKVKAATARVERAKVVVAKAQLQLRRMTIVAPVDGRVFRLIAHPGTRIGSGMTHMTGHDGSTVVTMYRPDLLQVRVDVRFEDLPQVHLEQPVAIDNPALSNPILGKVLFMSSEADIQKNTLQVKVAIDDPPPVFKPEMLVDVTFQAPAHSDMPTQKSQPVRLYVPADLVVQAEDSSFVWVADQSVGMARRTPLQLGRRQGDLVEVESGLTPTSRLIVSGRNGLEDGDRITVTGEATPLADSPSQSPRRASGDEAP